MIWGKKFKFTVQNLKNNIIWSLSVLCSPWLILTKSPQISGQNKSEAREPEGLVKLTYGIVASSLFERAGNSNHENFLNCELHFFSDYNPLFGCLITMSMPYSSLNKAHLIDSVLSRLEHRWWGFFAISKCIIRLSAREKLM